MEITGPMPMPRPKRVQGSNRCRLGDPARRVILINAAVDLKNRNYDEQIIQATTDKDNAVRAAAARALRHFKIDPNEVDATPSFTLSVEEALAMVNSTKEWLPTEKPFLPKRPVILPYCE